MLVDYKSTLPLGLDNIEMDEYHCRFLVQDNTQKILTEIRHHFRLKNDGEKWSRKNYFKIPRWPSELLLPSAKKSAQKG